MQSEPSALSPRISAVLTDVDGTLVTKDKQLTERAIAAVVQLRQRGIIFTVTSGRPPRGMRMLVEPLGLTMPMAAFNGGVIVLPDLSVLDERLLPDYLLPALIDMIQSHGLDVWLFGAKDWYVRSRTAPRVDRETSNIQFPPIVVPTLSAVTAGIVKVVAVSEDPDRVARCETALQQAFGTQVSATRSTPHYVDVTHPTANKGEVIARLSRYLNIPTENIATIGDHRNDILMFERSGLSIAMGNASDEVKQHANVVTASHGDEGFARAVENFILPRAQASRSSAVRPTGQLSRLGQSLWIENATQEQLSGGQLQFFVDELSVTGLLADAASFDHAASTAAQMLRPVFDRTCGVDGWVSLELTPPAHFDAAFTLASAEDMLRRVNCPNVMIGIPGMGVALPAIEEAIFRGLPINVTQLFSREHYLAAAEAFLRGIERRIAAGLPPSVVSVASVLVSPWDVAAGESVPPTLRGRLGIAMAQRTYKAYRSLLASPRWQRAFNAGTRSQRLLWSGTAAVASTQSDDCYVQSLVAPFTINAVSEATLRGLADHGAIKTLLHADGGDCEEVLAEIKAAGIDVYALASHLQREGNFNRLCPIPSL